MSGPASGSGRVAVVVVHFGEVAPTAACLTALAREGSRAARRLVVVDNGATLGPGPWHGAEVVSLAGNPGFGAGANAGVAALAGDPFDAIVVLNNDIEVANGYLDAALQALRHLDVGLAAGPLYLAETGGALWYAGGGINWLTGTMRQAMSVRAAARERTVGFIPGAAFAARPEAWRSVGGFDPGYFLYNEDVDLGLRLRRRGWRLLFCPAMVAVHRLGGVSGSAARSPLYLEHMTATRLRPFRPLAYRLYLVALHSGYALLRAGWYRAVVGGEAGRARAAAVIRGQRRALTLLTVGPRAE